MHVTMFAWHLLKKSRNGASQDAHVRRRQQRGGAPIVQNDKRKAHKARVRPRGRRMHPRQQSGLQSCVYVRSRTHACTYASASTCRNANCPDTCNRRIPRQRRWCEQGVVSDPVRRRTGSGEESPWKTLRRPYRDPTERYPGARGTTNDTQQTKHNKEHNDFC